MCPLDLDVFHRAFGSIVPSGCAAEMEGEEALESLHLSVKRIAVIESEIEVPWSTIAKGEIVLTIEDIWCTRQCVLV